MDFAPVAELCGDRLRATVVAKTCMGAVLRHESDLLRSLALGRAEAVRSGDGTIYRLCAMWTEVDRLPHCGSSRIQKIGRVGIRLKWHLFELENDDDLCHKI